MNFMKDILSDFVESDKNFIRHLLGMPNNATEKQKKLWKVLLLGTVGFAFFSILRVLFNFQPLFIKVITVIVLLADLFLLATDRDNMDELFEKPTFLIALASGLLLSFVGMLLYLSYAIWFISMIIGFVRGADRKPIYRILAALTSGIGGFALGFSVKNVLFELVGMIIIIIVFKYVLFGMTALFGVAAVAGVIDGSKPRSEGAQSVLDGINDEGVQYEYVVDEARLKQHLANDRVKLKTELNNIAYRNRHGK
ncbi:MAG: hypothetical protein R3Y63_03565 [Eubacteriales bacterium]